MENPNIYQDMVAADATPKNPETPSSEAPASPENIKELGALVKEVSEAFQSMESITKNYFDAEGVDFGSISVIERLIKSPSNGDFSFPIKPDKDEELPAISISDVDIRQVLGDAYGDDKDANLALFDSIYATAARYIRIRDQFVYIQSEYREAMQKQYDYYTSPEYEKKMNERLKAMEDEYATTTDEAVKDALGKAIAAVKSLNSMDYIFKRLTGDGSDKEVKTIASNFFEYHGSTYVVNKYNKKATKIGIGGDLYLRCLNIETRFLDETYHPFNNLFLFSMIRLIAYIDVYNKDDVMFAKNTMRMLLRLINHAFPTTESENAFLNVIKTYLDHFMPMRDKFIAENTSYIKYVESINTPTSVCAEYTGVHEESDDSKWITNVVDDDGHTHVISEIVTKGGMKLFADGRAIIRPNELPEEKRDKLAVLGPNNEAVTININTACVLEAIKDIKNNGSAGACIPERPTTPKTCVVIKGLWTSREGFRCASAYRDIVNVYIDGDHVWIDNYFVVNGPVSKDSIFQDVWLADAAGIIRTNISMLAFADKISAKK